MAFVTGFTEYWPLVIGSIIILVVLSMPGGFLGLLQQLLGASATGSCTNEPSNPKSKEPVIFI